jgi:NAD(P)-dependent dehydrogenase (short-subunit alcohol dehydrogenase family)
VSGPLTGRVALVAGATRGAGRGIAVALGEAGAIVYATGRSTRERRSEIGRPETIEETAELVTAAGGEGIAVAVDHLDSEQVRGLVARIEAEHGRLDVLVNDIWGAEHLFEWSKPVWEHDVDNGLRMLRLAIDTHLITSHHALPLLLRHPGGLVVEVTDGTAAYNADHYRVSLFYDLAKTTVTRLAWALGHELADHQATAVALTRAGCAPRRCSSTTASPRPTGATRPSAPRTSASPNRRATSAAPSPPSPPTRTPRAGTAAPSRAASSLRPTASPTSTEPAPTAGAIWSRSSSAKARRRATRATAEPRPERNLRTAQEFFTR